MLTVLRELKGVKAKKTLIEHLQEEFEHLLLLHEGLRVVLELECAVLKRRAF